MGKFAFSRKSMEILSKAHPDLQAVALEAIKDTPYDFGITESVRTLERQKELVTKGASKTMKSRHLPNVDGYSEAFDIAVYVNGKLTWEEGYYRKVAQAMFKAAIKKGIQIEWGGMWRTFFDGPHFQLPE